MTMVLGTARGLGGWGVGLGRRMVAGVVGGLVGVGSVAVAQCPPAPVVTADASGRCRVNLSWPAVPQALGFQVERSTTADFAAPTALGSAAPGAVGFTDTSPVAGLTNFYRVRALGIGGICPGGFGPFSTVVSATPAANLTAPTNLTVSLSCDFFQIAWDPVPGAEAYSVRWQLGGTSINTTTTGTQASLFGGGGVGDYTFVVTPVNACGGGTSIVRTLPFDGRLQRPEAVFSIVASRAAGGGVLVRWTPSARSDSQILRRRVGATGPVTATWTLDATTSRLVDLAAPTDVALSYSVAGVNATCGEGFAFYGPATSATPVGVLTAPASLSRRVGQTAVFSAAFSGLPTDAQLLWRKNGAPMTDSARISGTETASLTITGLTTSDTGGYDLLVTAPDMMPLSLPATLLVNNPCPTDFDDSGRADIDDIFVFLNAWFAGCP